MKKYSTILNNNKISKNMINSKFVNTDINARYKLNIPKFFSALWMYIFEKSKVTRPVNSKDIPVIKHNKKSLILLKDYSVLRIAHSTLLLKIDGKYWLTDPIFSDDTSPISWFSNKRFHDLPITINQLPEIEGVIL